MDLDQKLDLNGGLLNYRLFEFAGTPVTVATVVVIAFILIATIIISKVVQKAVRHAMQARGVSDAGTMTVTLRLLHYAILTMGLGVALQTIGIDLAALFAAGAIFAIAIGFAMQNIAQNFVSGVILLFERTIKPGDVLKIDDRVVRVLHMGIRATIVRTLNEDEIIVPNALIVQSSVTNFTLQDSVYRVRTIVGVSYSSDMKLVREILEETAAKSEWQIKERGPVVLLKEFGDSAVNFEISIWIDDPWKIGDARSAIQESIWWALKEADITIAFPQVDVHFDPPATDRPAEKTAT